MDSKLIRQTENVEAKPPQVPPEMPREREILDSPLVPTILIGTMLAAGLAPVILGL